MPKIVTEAERQQKRRAILDAAATEIARYGYDRANINTIAERAGIGRGTVYLYFDSKDEILGALLDTIGSLIDDTVRACLDLDLTWRERLRALSQSFVALAEEHRDFFRVHVSALHGVNRDVGAPMTRWLLTSIEHLAAAFQRAMDEGLILPMPADTLAVLVLSALESLALLPDMLQQRSPGYEDRAETLASLLWRGMMPLLPNERGRASYDT
ncbi:MAG TPA: TetR/AcrR family transcriptional regulator [Ktedonobacterales bacterium]|jgi:AcrR family transcriptional regulator